jgi:hypothetical protein
VGDAWQEAILVALFLIGISGLLYLATYLETTLTREGEAEGSADRLSADLATGGGLVSPDGPVLEDTAARSSRSSIGTTPG